VYKCNILEKTDLLTLINEYKVPLNGTIHQIYDNILLQKSQLKLTKEELLREKFKFLRKLEALEKKGVELTKKYNMDSDLAEMQGEYEMIMEEKTKQNSVKFQGNMMMAIINGIEFLNRVKETFHCGAIRHTELLSEKIKTVAFCGGAGSFLLSKAIRQKADIYITGDFKYHEFFDADKQIVIADIGHYESEQFTSELIYRILTEKFVNFAFNVTKVNTNPINYF
jgi:hypothetical protein